MPWHITKWFLFRSLLGTWKHKGLFLWFVLWKPGWVSGGKSHGVVGTPITEFPRDFKSQACPHWASMTLSITIQISYHNLDYHLWVFRMWISALVSHDSLYSLVCLSSLTESSFPVSLPVSYKSKKSCWFLTLYRILHALRLEWWLLNSLFVELEAECQKILKNKKFKRESDKKGSRKSLKYWSGQRK